VEVVDVQTGLGAATSETGTLSLFFVPDGGTVVRVRKVGYKSLLLPVKISAADTTPITLALEQVTTLPTVVTRGAGVVYRSPAIRGFLEREHNHATGYFITDSILRRDEGRQLSGILRSRLPGVGIAEGSGSSPYIVSAPRCSGGGPPEVYLDGVPMNLHVSTVPAGGSAVRMRDQLFNLNSIPVSDLAGIEFYPSTASEPIELPHTTAGFGALLLWTRDR
jgi:hypothetical protein